MFPSDMNNHYALHNARHKELEEAVEVHRLVSVLKNQKTTLSLRQRFGEFLIVFGQKLVEQRPTQNTYLTFSAR